MGFPPTSFLYGTGSSCTRLLEEAVEQEAASLREAAVEAEGEFVEVIVELGGTDGAMVDSEPPAIEKSGHAVNARHDDVGPGRRWRKCSSTGVRSRRPRDRHRLASRRFEPSRPGPRRFGRTTPGFWRRRHGHRPCEYDRCSVRESQRQSRRSISCLFPGRQRLFPGPRRRFRLPRHRPPGGLDPVAPWLGEAYEATSRPSGSCRGRVSSVAQGH